MEAPARLPLLFLAMLVAAAPIQAVEPPALQEFTLFAANDGRTFYHVRFETPANVVLPTWGERRPLVIARLPRLVHDDPSAAGLCLQPVTHLRFSPRLFEFVGRWPGQDTRADFRFLYAVPAEDAKNDPLGPCEWVETAVTLRSDNARIPPAQRRDRRDPLHADDLEGLWAAALQARFGQLHERAPDFGFYEFAQVALSRRYDLPVPSGLKNAAERPQEYRQLFEVLTGSASIAESLQSRRMLREPGAKGNRTVPVSAIRGVDLAQHPWQQMIGERKPAPEPLAKWVPEDNYYIRFRSLQKALAFGDWLDLWGANLLSAYDYRMRDHRLRERYEHQLCLPLERLAQALPADLVVELAVTGSDPYLIDGSDLTVIFHVMDMKRFDEILQPLVDEARQANKGRWRAAREDYGNVLVESFTTPLREVSLHRASVGDFVILSNSPVGLRRVLDTRSKKVRSLSESLDFRYMRTCFRADDPEEDGFGFLPDAFIRRLVGPVDRIKQLRRAEALAALHTVTNAALLAGWEQHIPSDADRGALIRKYLRDEDLEVPEGRPVAWDNERQLARSEVYNTLRFATPLNELPIDKVTPAEAREYERFRQDYLRLWTGFSDPVGLRFHQDGSKTRMEAYILPVIRSNDYQWLRELCGGGTAKLDPDKRAANTVLQFQGYANFNGLFGRDSGGTFFIRLDDSPLLKEIARDFIRWERDGAAWPMPLPLQQRLMQLPVVVGAEGGQVVRQVKEFLPLIRSFMQAEEISLEHRGVKINGVRLKETDSFARQMNAPDAKAPFRPTFYSVELGEGIYFSFRPEPLKQLIDHDKDKKEGKPNAQAETNAALLALPHAAADAREALNSYLEWQTHRRALPGNTVWYALHRSGVLPANATEVEERRVALNYLGYIPVSPDSVAYLYDRRLDEVTNRRHGSWRQPQLRPTLAVNAPLRAILEEFKTLRIDLRFREDGIYTTLTWER
jgi:hypothetical protein